MKRICEWPEQQLCWEAFDPASSVKVLSGPHNGPAQLLWSDWVSHNIKVIVATEDFTEGAEKFLGEYIFRGKLIMLQLEY